MGSSGGGAAPQVVTPGEAAQASVGTQAAGEQMAVANQPVEQYGNLYTTEQLGPAMTQTQQALANQAALQSARAQKDIQAQVDPLSYAQQQMRLQAATDRLGQLYGVSPSNYTYAAPSAYQVPGTSATPPLSQLTTGAGDIAKNLSIASVNKRGTNPQLSTPTGTNVPGTATQPYSYY